VCVCVSYIPPPPPNRSREIRRNNRGKQYDVNDDGTRY